MELDIFVDNGPIEEMHIFKLYMYYICNKWWPSKQHSHSLSLISFSLHRFSLTLFSPSVEARVARGGREVRFEGGSKAWKRSTRQGNYIARLVFMFLLN